MNAITIRNLPPDLARAIREKAKAEGFSTDQFGCLDDLWNQESGWNVTRAWAVVYIDGHTTRHDLTNMVGVKQYIRGRR